MGALGYGPVFVTGGRFKGRILYYDDDSTSKTANCYAGSPLDFVGSFGVQARFLREPTINDLVQRKNDIWKALTFAARRNMSKLLNSQQVHSLWSEKSMIDGILFERRMYGELAPLKSDQAVFLCHSSADKGMVRMVNDDLKNLGLNPWLDENVIKVGDSIVGKISAGLETSSVMIVFLSPGSVKSIWAKKEWQAFLARQLSGNKVKILPALIEECEIPAILTDIKYADFTESYHDGLREIHSALKNLEAINSAEVNG